MYVVDPCGIQNGWFEIDFTTFRLKPSDLAPQLAVNPIRVTIEVLRLNDDSYVEERLNVTAMYVHRHMDKAELKRLYPFMADQMDRQKFDATLFSDLKKVLPKP